MVTMMERTPLMGMIMYTRPIGIGMEVAIWENCLCTRGMLPIVSKTKNDRFPMAIRAAAAFFDMPDNFFITISKAVIALRYISVGKPANISHKNK
jgi:hypothetical protein